MLLYKFLHHLNFLNIQLIITFILFSLMCKKRNEVPFGQLSSQEINLAAFEVSDMPTHNVGMTVLVEAFLHQANYVP